MLSLYLTIWIALVLFAIGETGRSLPRFTPRPPGWARTAFALGLLLAIAHTLLAFDVVHNWVHDDAVRSTAVQTESVFGVRVGWGVYVNYLFFAVWLLDVWTWRAFARPTVTWTRRAFYMLMILNGAVIFATAARRLLGLAIVIWLAYVWAVSRAPSSRPR